MRQVRGALDGLPGVSSVTFDPPSDTFTVEADSAPGEAELRSAVLGQVIFPSLRNILGHLGQAYRGGGEEVAEG